MIQHTTNMDGPGLLSATHSTCRLGVATSRDAFIRASATDRGAGREVPSIPSLPMRSPRGLSHLRRRRQPHHLMSATIRHQGCYPNPRSCYFQNNGSWSRGSFPLHTAWAISARLRARLRSKSIFEPQSDTGGYRGMEGVSPSVHSGPARSQAGQTPLWPLPRPGSGASLC